MWSAFNFIPFCPHHTQVQLSLLKTASRQRRYSKERLIALCIGVIPPLHAWLFEPFWLSLIFFLVSSLNLSPYIGLFLPILEMRSFFFENSLCFIFGQCLRQKPRLLPMETSELHSMHFAPL